LNNFKIQLTQSPTEIQNGQKYHLFMHLNTQEI
jgi:hypothetical protein